MGYLTILGMLKILIFLSGDFLTGYFIWNDFEYLMNNFECILNLIELVRKWEMLAATMVKMSNSEKKIYEQEHVQHFLHKTCNQEVSGSFML